MEALQKHIGLDFILFHLPFQQYQVKYAYPRFFGNFTEALRKSRKPRKPVFNKIGEVVAAQLAQAS